MGSSLDVSFFLNIEKVDDKLSLPGRFPATDHSKAVVPVLSYSVWLCGLYYVALHALKSSRALCPIVS